MQHERRLRQGIIKRKMGLSGQLDGEKRKISSIRFPGCYEQVAHLRYFSNIDIKSFHIKSYYGAEWKRRMNTGDPT